MSSGLRETAFAKLNLALHVRSRRSDGYHNIDTLFAFVDDGDVLHASAAEELSLEISGPFAASLNGGSDNLVLRAATALRDRAGVSAGAKLHLEKYLPVASGIGGGSADAAAALRLLRRQWELDLGDEGLCEVAASLGADVPACIASRTAVGRSKGDRLAPAKSGFEGAPVLLVNPGVPLATGPVFAAWDGRDRGPLDIGNPSDWRNDLTAPATAIVPQIGQLLDTLGGLEGVLVARMSGSGATCFALFDDERARDRAAQAFPECWTLATRLRCV